MQDDGDNNWWTATDRETERERIEAYADSHRAKWPDDPLRRPGLRRRACGSWHEAGARLAAIQAQYDLSKEPYDKRIWLRALLIVWPTILRDSGIRSMKSTSKKRRAIRKRFAPFLLAMAMMANRSGPSSLGFDYPIIQVRRRKETQRTANTVKEDENSIREYKDEIIGRAVLQEYRRYPDRPNIDAAINAVWKLGTLEGVATQAELTVKARYHRYRKLAHERGYADARSFWAEVEERSWPNDHVWLADFPPK